MKSKCVIDVTIYCSVVVDHQIVSLIRYLVTFLFHRSNFYVCVSGFYSIPMFYDERVKKLCRLCDALDLGIMTRKTLPLVF